MTKPMPIATYEADLLRDLLDDFTRALRRGEVTHPMWDGTDANDLGMLGDLSQRLDNVVRNR